MGSDSCENTQDHSKTQKAAAQDTTAESAAKNTQNAQNGLMGYALMDQLKYNPHRRSELT